MADGAAQDSGSTVAPETGTDASPNAGGEATVAVAEGTAQQTQAAKDPIWEKLESLDPTALPENLRRKLEYPFLADYTRKTQTLAEEKARLADEKSRIAEAVAARFSGSPQDQPDEKTALMERVRGGDLEAIVPLLNLTASETVKPYVQEQAMRTAVERAEAMHPYVKERQTEIAQLLQANPDLRAMAQANNFAFAPFVMAGLALQIERSELQQKLTLSEKQIAEREAKAVEAYKAKVAGVPVTTTRSGSTPSAIVGKKPAESAREAALAAWIELGYNPDDFK